MNALLDARNGGRLMAIIAGAIAMMARTNSSSPAFAGTWFFSDHAHQARPPGDFINKHALRELERFWRSQ